MSNLSDKEIDRLSREASDLYEPDSSSLSWSRLEHMLTKQMPERPPDGFRFGRISPYVWGPAVVLLAGISFYFLKNSIYSELSTRKTEPVKQNSSANLKDSDRSDAQILYTDSLSSAQNPSASGNGNAQQSVQKPADQSLTEPTKNAKSESGQQSDEAMLNPGNHSGSEPSTTGDKYSQNRNKGSKIIASSSILSAGIISSGGKNSSANRSAKKDRSNNDATEEALSDASASGIIASESLNGQTSSAGADSKTNGASSHQLPSIVSTGAGLGMVKGNDSLLSKMGQPKKTAPQKSVHINRSLNIGFTFGADYTDAGGIPNNQFSNNVGITLGYYLTSKLSVNTGLIYSNKFYWSPGHGLDRPAYYTSPGNQPSTFAYSPDIEFVNGACNMYEVPLTLRYDFAKNDRSKFFVNAGLSSYFMLKQTYIYFFHSGGRQMAWKANDEAQANYWFGVGDLSFGLETDIGKGFSFQAEPFFRIPLTKMGLENLKMYSYGFMLSFRYAPVLSRSKK